MLQRIKEYFQEKKIIKDAIKKTKNREGISLAEDLAIDTCEWVDLYWNGKKRKFFIHEIDFQELLMCGRFPNVIYHFSKRLFKKLQADDEDLKIPEGDIKRMQEEEAEFKIELARRSMVQPLFQEVYDAILKMRSMNESDVADVIPPDFLNDLFLWYLKTLDENIKKNSETLISSALVEMQNNGK
ncbi:hypothetical protein [Treponema phagedenis]|uniref:hypothetical protein n=1 Tax=Treponema phagedenis TaxID=162 RepID=UPI0001F63A89|nr:hypothetical protein [Treponema phagedenis]EFW38963.1 hypothetical protein HMPREF9554_00538 [Treponema phagedenis F0421]NVP22720.1 hypothetical protein [Treponema phagedenis]NVP23231.1 hypothetical protein [Treponema phagedenis]QEJ95330.1 hypothetical protein FUT79_09020 [Treponema phagedenis]QEK06193.1 hypothetical protein FUT80_05390 [Treponema phagedenis]